MTREEIKQELLEDQNKGLGEILEETNEGFLYYDYDSGIETFYRDEQYCTIDWLKSRIYIGQSIQNKGLTADFVANMIKQAYGDEFVNAITTLNGIVIFSNEEELIEAIRFVADDEFEEIMDYDEMPIEKFDNVLGKLWYRMRTPMVYERECFAAAKRLTKEISYFNDSYTLNEEYSSCLIETIIHELRHCMLENHLFLNEQEYPVYLNSEDKVESFCNEKYNLLPNKYKRLPYKVA